MLYSPLPLTGEGPGRGLGQRAIPRSARTLSRPAGTLPRRGEKPHTLLVATTGGTAAARSAGPSTASWPSTHNATALTGR